MKWTQKTIVVWARKTFGYHGPLPIAIRGNKEMSELLSSLQNLSGAESAKICAMEAADVTIFMLQIAENLGFDLMELVQEKMDINEARTWTLADDGSHQHV
jgi:hypothetical protein